MSRIAILQGHPDPAGHHLLHALADAYAEGAAKAGHEVRRIEIAKLDFPLLRTQAEFESGAVPAALEEAAAAIRWAEHLVVFFPLWLGTMPALLKAFLEQVFRPGVAFAYQDKGLPRKLLRGRSARLVVTMGMPAFVYRFFYLAHGVRGLTRSVLLFVGISPVRETYIGGLGALSRDAAEAWIRRMRDLGAAAR